MRFFLILLVLAATAAAQQPLAHWRADGVAGGLLKDRRNRFHAKIEGPIRLLGEGDHQALVLDAANNRIVANEKTPATRLPRKELTVEARFRVDISQSWGGVVSCVEDTGEDEKGFVLGYHQDQMFFGVATTGPGRMVYVFSSARPRLDRFRHVAGTWDGKTVRLFIDGRLDATSDKASGTILYGGPRILALGTYRDRNDDNRLTGVLHEARIYARACSADELAERAAAFSWPEPETSNESRAPASAGWPAARRDRWRSGITPESLSLPLRPLWVHQSPHPPRPAWRPPAQGSFWQKLSQLEARNTDDHAFHPVVVGNSVLYASSADDRVRCLEITTGLEHWDFIARGPVRYAPWIDGGRVYFGCDAGWVYALEIETGAVVWERRIAPEDRRIPGNGRLVSPWPVRTGVVVDEGRVYATVGLFPREGAFAVALQAADGEVLWQAPLQQAPQGYLLASHSTLFIPTGRSTPVTVGRHFGRALGGLGGPGGTFAVLLKDHLLFGPGNSGELRLSRTFQKDTRAGFAGRQAVVTASTAWLHEDKQLVALNWTRHVELLPQIQEARHKHGAIQGRLRQVSGAIEQGTALQGPDGQPLSKADLKKEKQRLRQEVLAAGETLDSLEAELRDCVRWRTGSENHDALVMAGDVLFAGGKGSVTAHDSKTGKRLWTSAVPGTARALAVASGRLVVGTDTGAIVAFGNQNPLKGTDRGHLPELIVTPEPLPGLPKKGYVMVLGDEDIVPRVAASTEAHVALFVPPSRRTTAARNLGALHGVRVSVIGTAGAKLPVPDGIANAIVIPDTKRLTTRMRRVLRPFGGVVLARVGDRLERRHVAGAPRGGGQWTHMYADPGNTACSGDQNVTDDLRVQWFGGPGPRKMVDRHLRTTPPLFRDGRLFIPGNERVICLDAYNGTILWETEIPGLTRTGAPYDGGHMAVGPRCLWVAVGPHALGLDVSTGKEIVRHSVPRPDLHWGVVFVLEPKRRSPILLGTAVLPGAPIREQGLDPINEQYREDRPLVCAQTLFALDSSGDSKPLWVHEATIPQTSIAVLDRKVFLIESEAPNLTGRLPLATLLPTARLRAFDLASGRPRWNRAFPGTALRHSLFISAADGTVTAVGAYTRQVIEGEGENRKQRAQTWYEVFAFDANRGKLRWKRDHANTRPGAGGSHGEQVHHPVIVDGLLVAEPLAYRLADGAPFAPDGKETPWRLPWRGGCGTLSACRGRVFFRDSNPAVQQLAAKATREHLTRVNRPGCWISVIPAGGLVLLPEASSGCVCAYPIQTSLALGPDRR